MPIPHQDVTGTPSQVPFPVKFGYPDLNSMRDASTIIESEGPDIDWYVTPSLVSPGQYIVWDDSNPTDPGYIECLDEADAMKFHREAFAAEYGDRS